MLSRGLNLVTRSGSEQQGPIRRIAVINSNSSARVTGQLADDAAQHLLPGTHASFVNPSAGPQGIDSAFDMAVAAVETARLVRELEGDFDAFVIACGNDPGLVASRELTSKPVVGIAESGFLQACAYGGQFSVAVLAPHKRENMRSLVRSYRLDARLAAVVAAQSSSADATRDSGGLFEQLARECLRLQDADVALGEALVLPGSVMGRIAPRLSARIGIPVISGLLAGIRAAENLCDDLRRRTENEE